jgi:hypothetical protein
MLSHQAPVLYGIFMTIRRCDSKELPQLMIAYAEAQDAILLDKSVTVHVETCMFLILNTY